MVVSRDLINISDLMDKPFKNGGRGPDEYDCYGLVREIYRRIGIELPELFVDCYNVELINNEYQIQLQHLTPLHKPETWAIMAIKFNEPKVNHFGVYLGFGIYNRCFIHTRESANTCITSIDDYYWKRNIVGYYKWNP
jgi:cell wall-associated NlpC family hydrolase